MTRHLVPALGVALILSLTLACSPQPEISDIAIPVDGPGPQFTTQRATGEADGKASVPGFLTVQNDYNVTQHVFLNTEYIGTVASGSSQTWQMEPGRYTVTCADSTRMTDNPIEETYTIAAGEIQTFRVFVD